MAGRSWGVEARQDRLLVGSTLISSRTTSHPALWKQFSYSRTIHATFVTYFAPSEMFPKTYQAIRTKPCCKHQEKVSSLTNEMHLSNSRQVKPAITLPVTALKQTLSYAFIFGKVSLQWHRHSGRRGNPSTVIWVNCCNFAVLQRMVWAEFLSIQSEVRN